MFGKWDILVGYLKVMFKIFFSHFVQLWKPYITYHLIFSRQEKSLRQTIQGHCKRSLVKILLNLLDLTFKKMEILLFIHTN